jgi:hypothetical protein
MKFFKWVVAVAAPVFCGTGARAESVSFHFRNITTDTPANYNSGGNYTVSVAEVAGDPAKVFFWFTNESDQSTNASSITDVYFDDNSSNQGPLVLSAGPSLSSSGSGVAFTQLASPSQIAGMTDVTPWFMVKPDGASADSEGSWADTISNGVNATTEWLGVTFALQGGKTYADVRDSMFAGQIRVGIFVQGFQPGGSESFYNLRTAAFENAEVPSAPLPGPALAGGLLLIGLGGKRLKHAWAGRA